MAQKVQVILEDDLDGGEASRCVTFGFGGATYGIDPDDKNAAKLEKALTPLIEAGRKVRKSAAARGKKCSGSQQQPRCVSGRLPTDMSSPHAVAPLLGSARPTTRCTDRERSC